LGDSFARTACGFFPAGRPGPAEAAELAEALPARPPPNGLADLLGGLIAP
jgi:hypothetical protein